MNGRDDTDSLAMIDNVADFIEDLTRWLETRIPKGYYGKVKVPIQDGRVATVMVTQMARPKREKM